MTSSNNGHGRLPPGPGGARGFDAPGETVKGQPAQGRPPLAGAGADGAGDPGGLPGALGHAGDRAVRAPLPAEGGIQLPPDFKAEHFLDPAFLAGMANELYGEGRP